MVKEGISMETPTIVVCIEISQTRPFTSKLNGDVLFIVMTMTFVLEDRAYIGHNNFDQATTQGITVLRKALDYYTVCAIS